MPTPLTSPDRLTTSSPLFDRTQLRANSDLVTATYPPSGVFSDAPSTTFLQYHNPGIGSRNAVHHKHHTAYALLLTAYVLPLIPLRFISLSGQNELNFMT